MLCKSCSQVRDDGPALDWSQTSRKEFSSSEKWPRSSSSAMAKSDFVIWSPCLFNADETSTLLRTAWISEIMGARSTASSTVLVMEATAVRTLRISSTASWKAAGSSEIVACWLICFNASFKTLNSFQTWSIPIWPSLMAERAWETSRLADLSSIFTLLTSSCRAVCACCASLLVRACRTSSAKRRTSSRTGARSSEDTLHSRMARSILLESTCSSICLISPMSQSLRSLCISSRSPSLNSSSRRLRSWNCRRIGEKSISWTWRRTFGNSVLRTSRSSSTTR
mmetsp:Transcript_45594/g.63375  ORF Transcript_45594/g.63375 Transcript_45594/m.63375 type:complete len:282 (+) Transcript_45594:323-1168(+)